MLYFLTVYCFNRVLITTSSWHSGIAVFIVTSRVNVENWLWVCRLCCCFLHNMEIWVNYLSNISTQCQWLALTTHDSFDLRLFRLQRLTLLHPVDLLSMNNEDISHCLETITRRFFSPSQLPLGNRTL